MKWIKLKEIIDEHFPPEGAMLGDIIGELNECPEEVKRVIVTLDVTFDTIAQAIENNVDMIIAHHPFYWGDALKNDDPNNDYVKHIASLLKSSKLGLYVAHTNADFASNSLAYMQALAIDLKNIEQNNNNLSVTGYLNEEKTLLELTKVFRNKYELYDFPFRTNVDPEIKISKLTFATGTAGEYGINIHDGEALHVIGEVKHHEWVKANQMGIKVLELTHFSETIFKHAVSVLLDNEEIEIIMSREENGYKII